jgi:hypothetical protein
VEMLKVKELIELVVLEALIRGVREHTLWRKLYVLLDKSLSKVNQFMKNHIRLKRPVYFDIDLLIFTRTTNINDFSSEVIRVPEANIFVPPL